MRFDLRNADKAMKFVSEFTKIDESMIIELISKSPSGIDADDYIKHFKIDLDSLQIEDVRYIVSHVTTSIDNLEFMKNNGLMDLATLLSLESPLSSYLKRFDVSFEIENKLMFFKNQCFNVDYYREGKDKYISRESHEGRIDSVAHKICYDNQISAFFSMEGDKKYLTQIHRRPEILINLSNLCKVDLQNPWAKEATGYVVVFEEKFENFEWFTFYDEKYDYLEDMFSKKLLRKFVISKALNLLWDSYHCDHKSNRFAYMAKDYIIPWSNVIECREIV